MKPQCRQRLVELIAAAIPNLKVEKNASLDTESLRLFPDVDRVLPTRREEIGLRGHFGETPASTFMLDQIWSRLGGPWDESAPVRNLTSIPEFADPDATAESLVSLFETLPWRYELVTRTSLPASWSSVLGQSFTLSSVAELLLPTEEFRASRPLPQSDPWQFFTVWTRQFVPKAWDETCFYLSSRFDGYVTRYGKNSAFDAFIAQAKALAGFLMTLNLLQPATRQFWQTRNAVPIFQYSLGTNAANLLNTQWLPDNEAWEIADLKAMTDVTPKRLNQLLLLPIAMNDTDRLANAARWYFDAHAATNDPMRFVQAMIVLEILFGDKKTAETVGIEKLIANRCAYSIGGSAQDRHDIIDAFGRIYETRSAIVHRGKDSLSGSEREDYYRLLIYCKEALRRELRMAAVDTFEPT